MTASAFFLKCAGRLTVLRHFPNRQEVIEFVADELAELCREPIILNGERWSPEDQVDHVTREAARLGKWSDVHTLRAIHDAKFRPSEMVFDGFEKPAVVCVICSDWGYVREANGRFVWCQCEQGTRAAADSPALLELLNKTDVAKPKPVLSAPSFLFMPKRRIRRRKESA